MEEEADGGAGQADEVADDVDPEESLLYMPSPMLKPWREVGDGG